MNQKRLLWSFRNWYSIRDDCQLRFLGKVYLFQRNFVKKYFGKFSSISGNLSDFDVRIVVLKKFPLSIEPPIDMENVQSCCRAENIVNSFFSTLLGNNG